MPFDFAFLSWAILARFSTNMWSLWAPRSSSFACVKSGCIQPVIFNCARLPAGLFLERLFEALFAAGRRADAGPVGASRMVRSRAERGPRCGIFERREAAIAMVCVCVCALSMYICFE